MIILGMVARQEPSVEGIMICAGLGLLFTGLCIVFAIIQKLTTDFVVPIMYLRRSRCLAAWREFRDLLTANAGRFALYLLFQIVIAMVVGAIVLMVFIVTCCVACCLAAIPYLGTVLLLPVLVFKRCYTLLYFAQFGPGYNVFPPEPPRPL